MTTEKHALNFLERSSRSSSRRRSVDYTMKVIIWEENRHHPIPKKMKPTRTEMLKIPYFSAYSIKWLLSTYCPTLSLCLTLILISHVEAATTFIYLVIFLLPQTAFHFWQLVNGTHYLTVLSQLTIFELSSLNSNSICSLNMGDFISFTGWIFTEKRLKSFNWSLLSFVMNLLQRDPVGKKLLGLYRLSLGEALYNFLSL